MEGVKEVVQLDEKRPVGSQRSPGRTRVGGGDHRSGPGPSHRVRSVPGAMNAGSVISSPRVWQDKVSLELTYEPRDAVRRPGTCSDSRARVSVDLDRSRSSSSHVVRDRRMRGESHGTRWIGTGTGASAKRRSSGPQCRRPPLYLLQQVGTPVFLMPTESVPTDRAAGAPEEDPVQDLHSSNGTRWSRAGAGSCRRRSHCGPPHQRISISCDSFVQVWYASVNTPLEQGGTRLGDHLRLSGQSSPWWIVITNFDPQLDELLWHQRANARATHERKDPTGSASGPRRARLADAHAGAVGALSGRALRPRSRRLDRDRTCALSCPRDAEASAPECEHQPDHTTQVRARSDSRTAPRARCLCRVVAGLATGSRRTRRRGAPRSRARASRCAPSSGSMAARSRIRGGTCRPMGWRRQRSRWATPARAAP